LTCGSKRDSPVCLFASLKTSWFITFSSVIRLVQFLPNCASYLVVEHNGDVYPCDFFVKDGLPAWVIFTRTALMRLLTKPERFAFHNQKENLHDTCLQCQHRSFCNGDCIKFQAALKNGDFTGLSEYCTAIKNAHEAY
jgi:radical SAM protein with 4Fe4S-binding SPASM domain